MTYSQLLATIPKARYDAANNCLTCQRDGFCQDRAESLVCGIQVANIENHIDTAELLQWLLDSDEIGMMKNENPYALGAAFLEWKQVQQ